MLVSMQRNLSSWVLMTKQSISSGGGDAAGEGYLDPSDGEASLWLTVMVWGVVPPEVTMLHWRYTTIHYNSTSRHETLDRYSHGWFSRIQLSPNGKTNGTPCPRKQHFLFLGDTDSSYGLSVATFYYGSQIPLLRSGVDSFHLSACWYWTTRALWRNEPHEGLGFPQVQPAEKLYTFALNDLVVLSSESERLKDGVVKPG